MAIDKLISKGWCVDEKSLSTELDSLEEESRPKNPEQLEEFLLNQDLTAISSPGLANNYDRKKGELIGPIVLQLTHWRNISYPIINRHDQNDGICVLTLSDGRTSVKAFHVEPLTKISGNTPYGSKVLLTGKIRSENGFLLLNNTNASLLGGNVDTLVDKWKAEKFSTKDRAVTTAPKWVPFAKAKTINMKVERNFKAMKALAGTSEADKIEDEKTLQFNAARKAQIEALDIPAANPAAIEEVEKQAARLRISQPREDGNEPPQREFSEFVPRSNIQNGRGRGQSHGNSRDQRGSRGDSRPTTSARGTRGGRGESRPSRGSRGDTGRPDRGSRGRPSSEQFSGRPERSSRGHSSSDHQNSARSNNFADREQNGSSRGGGHRGRGRGSGGGGRDSGRGPSRGSRGPSRGGSRYDSEYAPQPQQRGFTLADFPAL